MEYSKARKYFRPRIYILTSVTLFFVIIYFLNLGLHYVQFNNVYFTQNWIASLVDYSDKFYPLVVKDDNCAISPLRANPGLVETIWPDLTLLIPVVPNGEKDLQGISLRHLRFFWPRAYLKLLFIVDGELPLHIRDPFVERIKKSLVNNTMSVQVKLNYIPKETYKRGHSRQQLIMFWADNFTNSDYVGFLDDDSMISNHILLEDIFDGKGRPHVWGRSTVSNWTWWRAAAATSGWTDNSDSELMHTMRYFPVVVKTCHLKLIRENILKHRSEFGYFDEFFRDGLMRQRNGQYSQFNIMHQHLWNLKRNDYNWHLAADSPENYQFRKIKGVTYEMLYPWPQSSVHFTYDRRTKEKNFQEGVLKRGFCYSLTKLDFDSNEEFNRVCTKAGYSWDVIMTVPNIDQWVFDDFDSRWDNRTVDAHKKRIVLNRSRSDWNKTEIRLIFTT